MTDGSHAPLVRSYRLLAPHGYEQSSRFTLQHTAGLNATCWPGHAFRKVRQVAVVLSDKTQNDGPTQVKLTLTHEQIAEIIGTTRETVTRLFSEFKKKKFLQLRGSTLAILNRPALETIVQS